MDCDLTGEFEVEIMVLSDLLDTPVYSYYTRNGWTIYSLAKVLGTFDFEILPGIYP